MSEIMLDKKGIFDALEDIIEGSLLSANVSEQRETFLMIASNLKIVKENLKDIFDERK